MDAGWITVWDCFSARTFCPSRSMRTAYSLVISSVRWTVASVAAGTRGPWGAGSTSGSMWRTAEVSAGGSLPLPSGTDGPPPPIRLTAQTASAARAASARTSSGSSRFSIRIRRARFRRFRTWMRWARRRARSRSDISEGWGEEL